MAELALTGATALLHAGVRSEISDHGSFKPRKQWECGTGFSGLESASEDE